MASLLGFIGGSVLASLVLYFGLAGGLYYARYVRRRGDAATWKLQPTRWLSPAIHRHAIALGTFNLVMASVISGVVAWLIFRRGYGSLYFDLRTHGVVFSLSTALAVFVVTDAGAYFAHRAYHQKALFSAVHRWHHRYGAPTPFTVTAMHPVEFLTYQAIFVLPAFVVPMHVVAYYGLLLYIFYYNTLDHSGIKHRSWWPWQPPSLFHDDHHKHFHCNFGQSSLVWDRLFGTLRRRDRRYGEHVFGGRGEVAFDARRVEGATTGAAGPEFIDYFAEP